MKNVENLVSFLICEKIKLKIFATQKLTQIFKKIYAIIKSAENSLFLSTFLLPFLSNLSFSYQQLKMAALK